MPDLASIRSVVRTLTLAETDDVSNTNVDLFINQGYRWLSTQFRWPWLEATATITVAADVASYDLPADYRKLWAVRDADERRTLTRLSFEEALNRWGGDPPTGTDAKWSYVYADDIFLLPVPSAAESDAYTLYYQKQLTIMASDGASPEFAAEFHLILADYAIARVWEHEEDFDKARLADVRFAEQVEAMARYYFRREAQTPLVYGGGIHPNPAVHQNLPWLDDAGA
jgi:hypothetical protein